MRYFLFVVCLTVACTAPFPKNKNQGPRRIVVYKDIISDVQREKKLFGETVCVRSNGRVGSIEGPGKLFVAVGDTILTRKIIECNGTEWFDGSKHQKTGEDIAWR